MSLESALAKVFGLKSDEAWRRHANPWSVYTRIPIPVLLVAAIWSRVWLGWWALVPVAVCLAWTALNPRVFPPPRTLDSWASRSVMGETLWAKRKSAPVPPRHRTAPFVLSAVSAAGLPFLVWGLVVLDPWMTLFGLAVQTTGKLWFLDRMALLYDDVSSAAGSAPPQTDR
jgi:hypothetical protein